MIIHVKAEIVTNKGKFRIHNEENFLLNDKYMELTEENKKSSKRCKVPAFLAICEGVGETRYGRKEAYYTVKALKAEKLKLEHLRTEEVIREIDKIVRRINDGIIDHTVLGSEIGTTLAALFFHERRIFLINIGNNLIYEIGEARMSPLLSAGWRDTGGKKEEEGDAPVKHIHLQYLGSSNSESLLEPEYGIIHYKPGITRYLLCTGGMAKSLSEEKMKKIIFSETKSDKICNTLVEQALQNGSNEDLTVMLAEVKVTA
ncbi:MAG: hypothetical protein E7256_02985 [Lachnospiraceae bacterium]|nr:hypothetical protein [Lachnospiraceae bacterium]